MYHPLLPHGGDFFYRTPPMTTKQTIIDLAKQYETADFIVGDPSWFMHQVSGSSNQETLAFIASTLSFGSRKQFLPKIQGILDAADGEVFSWIRDGKYKSYIPESDKCFYRLCNYTVMHRFCNELESIIRQYGTLKDFVGSIHKGSLLNCIEVVELFTSHFAKCNLQGLIPKDTQSPCKRLCMFLRWMVRDNSPVDLGLWSDIIDKRTLIIPLDTHVFQQANRLGLISSKTASMSTARKISQQLQLIFPDDPLKGDFALFGYGVNN